VNVGLFGSAGVITGFSPHLAVSEKVDDLNGGGIPSGGFDGVTTPFVIRGMLELCTTSKCAIELAQAVPRTCGIWLGVGDVQAAREAREINRIKLVKESNSVAALKKPFQVLRYQRDSADVFADGTAVSKLLHHPDLPNVSYIDKHAQPSTSLDLTQALAELMGMGQVERASSGQGKGEEKGAGTISGRVVGSPHALLGSSLASTVPRMVESGDSHIAVYDYRTSSELLFLSFGSHSETANSTKAFENPFISYRMEALWSEKRPSGDVTVTSFA